MGSDPAARSPGSWGVTLDEFTLTVGPRLAADLGYALREAVNVAALEITRTARMNLQRAIGSEQRLSGYQWNPRGGRVTHGEGRRINPFYLKADSTVHPTALIRVRGPAHFVERPRKGGYKTRPRHKGTTVSGSSLIDLWEQAARESGQATGREMRALIKERVMPPALGFADGEYRY